MSRHKIRKANAALNSGQMVRGMDDVTIYTDSDGTGDEDNGGENPSGPVCPVGDISPTCENDVIIHGNNNTDDEVDADDSDAIFSDTTGVVDGFAPLFSSPATSTTKKFKFGVPYLDTFATASGSTLADLIDAELTRRGVRSPKTADTSLNTAEKILTLKRKTFSITSGGLGAALDILRLTNSTINTLPSLAGISFENLQGATGFTEKTFQELSDLGGTTRGYKNFFTQKHFFFDLTKSNTTLAKNVGMTTGDAVISAELHIPIRDQFAPRSNFSGLNNHSTTTKGIPKVVGRKFECIKSRADYSFGSSFGLTGYTGSGGFTAFSTFAGSITPDVDTDTRSITMMNRNYEKNEIFKFDIKNLVEDALANEAGILRFLMRPTGSEFTTDGISSGGLDISGTGATPGGPSGHGFSMYRTGTLKPKVVISFREKINSGATRNFYI